MRIGVRGGHTELCSGAVGIINELTEDRKVKDAVISKLKSLGHTVIDCTPPKNYTSDQGIDLAYGVSKANSNGVDLFVSIHFNNCYNTYNGALGTEVCVYRNNSTAQNIVNSLAALGFKNRGQKIRTGLYELRATNMTAVIVETCFVEATEDVRIYKGVGVDVVANAIVKGITGKTVSNGSTVGSTGNTAKPTVKTHLRDFQAAYNRTYGRNIAVDGIWGSETEGAINSTIVKYGQCNPLVAWVQCRVGVKADGIFGAQTHNAVSDFQRKYYLVSDGIAGPKTIKKILQIYNW